VLCIRLVRRRLSTWWMLRRWWRRYENARDIGLAAQCTWSMLLEPVTTTTTRPMHVEPVPLSASRLVFHLPT